MPSEVSSHKGRAQTGRDEEGVMAKCDMGSWTGPEQNKD